jgi:hypothetical protein
MTDQEIGAYVTFAIWGLAFCALVRTLGLARTLWFVGILFFLAVRLMLGFVRAFRAD